MLSLLYSGQMITVFPKRARALLSLVVFLSYPYCLCFIWFYVPSSLSHYWHQKFKNISLYNLSTTSRFSQRFSHRTFGYALYGAQMGVSSPDGKPLKGFGGAGVLELIDDYRGGTCRAFTPSGLPLRFMG